MPARRLFLVLFLLCWSFSIPAGCVKITEPGKYDVKARKIAPGLSPVPLRVKFLKVELTGRYMDYPYYEMKEASHWEKEEIEPIITHDLTEQIAEALHIHMITDFSRSNLFSDIRPVDEEYDLDLACTVTELEQYASGSMGARTWQSYVYPITFGALGVLNLLGVPTDGGYARIAMACDAIGRADRKVLKSWKFSRMKRGVTGLYYPKSWPMNDLLLEVVGELMENIRRDGPELATLLNAKK